MVKIPTWVGFWNKNTNEMRVVQFGTEQVARHIYWHTNFVKQVAGLELDPVPGGYSSGRPVKTGSYNMCIRKTGHFSFRRYSWYLIMDSNLKMVVCCYLLKWSASRSWRAFINNNSRVSFTCKMAPDSFNFLFCWLCRWNRYIPQILNAVCGVESQW